MDTSWYHASAHLADCRHLESRAADEMRSKPKYPLLGSKAARNHPQTQSGALAWRRRRNGDVEVLLVRKLRSKTWGVPKGKVKSYLSPSDNAAKEAFEEAGVKGRMSPRAAGSYRAVKRAHDFKIVIEVAIYLLEVTSTARTWREKHKRDIGWFAPDEAAALLKEPMLAELCRSL
jgi:ADP-ribose pyrophosphatase YjhB (NUDIX family)